MSKFESDIKLGTKYRDKHSDLEGVATGVTFFENGCVRALLERVVEGKIEEQWFDEQRLTAVETGKPVESKSPRGGPREHAPRRSDAPR